MKKILLTSLAILATSAAIAQDQGLENCIAAAQKQKSGDMLKLEKLNLKGKAVYELEIADANGFEWEFMCDANSGKIIETERSQLGKQPSI